MIHFDKKNQIFHLSNNKISYVMQIEEGGNLAHIYFGKKITHYSGHYRYPRLDRSFSPNPAGSKDRLFSLDTLMMEFPGNGFGDFREAAYDIQLPNGSHVAHFIYQSHEISQGKPALAGLPQTHGAPQEIETLQIILRDEVAALELVLNYSIFTDTSAIIRSSALKNDGLEPIVIHQLASQSLDFPNRPLDLIQLNGAWAKEQQISREPVQTGIKKLDSKRGSSSHQQNPFVILADPATTEFSGECYGVSLLYSGNHETIIEKDPYDQTRLIMGINSYRFAWTVPPQESFQSPEVVTVYSNQGLNQMSQTYHRFYNSHLIRGQHQLTERPTLINNWEATYFDFDEEKLEQIVDEAKVLGIELFVLDDGWFGARENDLTSLGDWYENKGKLASGLRGFAEKVHQKGLKFGLWLEPEMISEASELYRQHPDWVLKVPGRSPALSRSQFVLDFSREDVRKHIFDQLALLFNEVPIDYIKWDMNRNMTDVYSLLLDPTQQGEVFHRYILGLYDFLERLTAAHPTILFEGCSGGGGRFDAGFLYYMPQIWTSDNTDAVARLKIQYGTSLSYPASSMGSHVSAVPNHQTQRITDLAIRGNVAMSGVLGYELDLTTVTDEEKAAIKEQVAFYKKHRQLFQYGTFIRLLSPFAGNDTAWMYVSEDKQEAIVFYFRVLAEASAPLITLKLAGLAADTLYQMGKNKIGGDELMQIGFYIDPALSGDYATQMVHLTAINND
ncbi:alpha-galactosidase [Enterococcus gallinarum]|uniref:alpha-galactosidase n=1 Tax=Enterococcus gallinarum TaxID=1353 RepID=UPI001D174EAE|nr:alpha-galactosidase [Enterococcus gallinarum]MCC4044223.1 alpha-galactosidase [Enterococcus gallinarum]